MTGVGGRRLGEAILRHLARSGHLTCSSELHEIEVVNVYKQLMVCAYFSIFSVAGVREEGKKKVGACE